MTTLQRRPKSGFVKFPKGVEKRIIDGSARFRTKCDMIVGPCACGGVHQESDVWVQQTLSEYDLTFEPLILRPDDVGMVLIPRYWAKTRARQDCTTLHGACRCGQRHTANEHWVRDMLSAHCAVIEDCPEATLPTVGSPDPIPQPRRGRDLAGCDCDTCREHREREQHTNHVTPLSRGEI